MTTAPRILTELLRRLPPRGRKILVWSVAGFAIYLLAGFFLVPVVLKWQLVKRLPELTQRSAAIRQVKVNPLALSLTIRGLALNEPDGRPFASWEELYVNFQSSSLFRWAWTFDEIRVVEPFAEVILFKDGRVNLANLFPTPTNAPPRSAAPTSVPRVNVFHFQITNGFFALEDRLRRSVFRTEYRPINLDLTGFTTQPDSDTPYSFRAESDAGRSVTWAGDFTVQPLRSAGHLEVTGVQLPRYQPYLEDFTTAVVTNGLADVQFDYRFTADTNGLQLVVMNAALQVEQVQILDPATQETVAGLRGLDVKGAGFDLRENSLRVGAVKVSEATVLARRQPDGGFNLLDLLAVPAVPPRTPPAPVEGALASALTVEVDDVAIEQGAVRFEDRMLRPPFSTELKPIEVTVKGFSTRPGSDARYTFQVTSEVGEIFGGDGSFSINPVRSVGELRVRTLDVKKYVPYAEEFFRGRIVSGQFEASVPYRVTLDTNGLRAGVTNLAVKLTELEVLMPESGERVKQIREIGLQRVEASLEDRRGRVGLFKGDGGSVLVRRHEDGTINLLGLLAVSQTNAPVRASSQSSVATGGDSALAFGGWTLSLDEVELDNYSIQIEDLVPAKPATFLLDQLTLNVRGASTVASAPISATAGFRFNETAHVRARGTATRSPLAADVEVVVTNLDLRIAQPYLEPFVALDLASGLFSTAGRARVQTNDPASPMLTFAGDVAVTNFATTDAVASKELVRWDDLQLKGIAAAVAPLGLKVETIRLVRPAASVRIGADRQLNLAGVLRQESSATNTAAPAPSTAAAGATPMGELFPIAVGSVAIEGAALAFADDSVQPAVAMGIEELSGTIRGLSSTSGAPAELNFAGRVGAQSPFAVAGRVNPFPATLFVDLTLTNANTQLTPLTGYMEKYGGYPLRKGLVSTSLRYRIEGAALQAENKIQVDQFTLGPRNESPDATTLPLKLGVALLKDSDGRIDLDVPVQGRLDDPEFSLGPIVLKVVVNLIVKAATSPFKLLGALVGGGGDELSFVQFDPGSTNLVAGELDKLGKLAAAMAKRPALNLEVEGAVDPQLDRDALALQKLTEQLKAQRLKELTTKAKGADPGAGSELEPEHRERLLRAAFVAQFGTNIAEVIQTNLARLQDTNQPVVAAPTARRKGGLVRGITGIFRGSDDATKAEKQLPKADRAALGLATPDLMETLLVERIGVSEAEFQQLITARARWVQEWFVREGLVPAERLYLVAPKAVGAGYTGKSQVNLTVN